MSIDCTFLLWAYKRLFGDAKDVAIVQTVAYDIYKTDRFNPLQCSGIRWLHL